MKLSGCAAVVTGGASGLGEATARALAAEAVKVAIFDLNAALSSIRPPPPPRMGRWDKPLIRPRRPASSA